MKSSSISGTVDITGSGHGTRHNNSFSSGSTSWLDIPSNGSFSNGGSNNSWCTEIFASNGIDSSENTGISKGSGGVSRDDGNSSWIWLNEKFKLPFSLDGSVGRVGGFSRSSGSGRGFLESSVVEEWGWNTEVTTELISNSVVWNLKGFSNFTTNVKNNSVVSSNIDSFTVSKSHSNWNTSIIWSGDVSDSRSVEPVFNGSAVKSSIVTSSGFGLESASGLGTFRGNSDHAELFTIPWFLSIWLSAELVISSLDSSPVSHSSSLLSHWGPVNDGSTHLWTGTFNGDLSGSR